MKPFKKLYLIAGVPKAGTTALHYALHGSKCLRFPWRKEPHYLCKQTKAIKRGVYYDPIFTESNYVEMYPQSCLNHPAIDGDPTSFQDNLAAQEALKLADEVKAVVILRNPIHRYLSHYFMDRRTYFEERLLTATIDTDISTPLNQLVQERRYLWNSTYAPWIKLWKEILGAKNVLFIQYEALACHALPISAQITTFFEANDLLGTNLFKTQVNSSQIVRNPFSRYILQYRAKHSAMQKLYMLIPRYLRVQIWNRVLFKPGREFTPLLSDHVRLRDHMAADIRETGELLGWNVDDWLNVNPSGQGAIVKQANFITRK